MGQFAAIYDNCSDILHKLTKSVPGILQPWRLTFVELDISDLAVQRTRHSSHTMLTDLLKTNQSVCTMYMYMYNDMASCTSRLCML